MGGGVGGGGGGGGGTNYMKYETQYCQTRMILH